MEIPGLPNAPKELLTAGAGLLAFALLFAIGPGAAIGVTLCEAFIGETAEWLLTDCIGFGGITMGLPGLAAQVCFLAPMEAAQKIKKTGDVGNLPLLPYSAMCVSGFIWINYGLALKQPAVWLPNVAALLFGAYYTAIFCMNCPAYRDSLPGTKNMHLVAIATLCAAVAVIRGSYPDAEASDLLGKFGTVLVVTMFGGPLVAIQTVVKDRSTASLPFNFTVATFVNCLLWFIFGTCVVTDVYIWFPNALGLGSSVLQLALFAAYGISRAGTTPVATAVDLV